MIGTASRGTKGEDLIERVLADMAERVLCSIESQVKKVGEQQEDAVRFVLIVVSGSRRG